MMRKRYYCDYCEKLFIDDLQARKKHLRSSYHIRLKNLHFEVHREPEQILREELSKTPCKRFFQNGICQFAGICKYSHYTPEGLWEIKQMILKKKQKIVTIPLLEPWIQNYIDKKRNTNKVEVHWSYSQEFEQRSDLPPSLKRFDKLDIPNCTISDWDTENF